MEAKLFGALPVGLHAEHGLWSRPPDSASEWSSHCEPSSDWREGVRPVRASLAWHYRMVEPELADRRAQELAPPAGSLQELLGDAPVEIIAGARVIELRPCGVNKGTIVPPLVAAMPAEALIVALGDDRTDEDLFSERHRDPRGTGAEPRGVSRHERRGRAPGAGRSDGVSSGPADVARLLLADSDDSRPGGTARRAACARHDDVADGSAAARGSTADAVHPPGETAVAPHAGGVVGAVRAAGAIGGAAVAAIRGVVRLPPLLAERSLRRSRLTPAG